MGTVGNPNDNVADAATQAMIVAAIARAKREILTDMSDGPVPDDVKRFSELHDYVDANEYGGLCEEDIYPVLNHYANEIQCALDGWLVDRDNQRNLWEG